MLMQKDTSCGRSGEDLSEGDIAGNMRWTVRATETKQNKRKQMHWCTKHDFHLKNMFRIRCKPERFSGRNQTQID